MMQNKDKINTPGTEYTNAAKPGTAVALGMFDGMHVGHKKIIDATVLIARQSGLVPAVFTFKNHPQELFGKKVLRLCSNETRAALMRRQGIELVDEVEFTSAIRDLSAESFIRMLAERLNPKIIVAGFNYTFGKKKQGNSETLQRLCQKYGIKTAIIQPVLLGREPVSSTRVRNMITCGNVQDAQLLLGRAYALDGIIVQNKRIGRTIGYPTAMLLSRLATRWAAMIAILFVLPMWMNFLLRTYAWMGLLSVNGPVNTLLGFIGLGPYTMLNTSGAVVLGMVYNYVPYMILPLYTSMTKIDQSLVEAAQDLGANTTKTLVRVLIPMSVPGISTGITMVFVPAVSTFVISRMLGGGSNLLIGDLIEMQFLGNSYNLNVGSAMSLVLMIIVLLCMSFTSSFDEDEMEGVS